VEKSSAKRPIGRPSKKCVDHIRLELTQLRCETGRRMQLAQYHVKCQALILAVFKLGVLLSALVWLVRRSETINVYVEFSRLYSRSFSYFIINNNI
jgi:hypothetical protein